MISILGGLGAALAWAAATLASSRASRMIGSGSTLSWVMVTGLVVALPLVAVGGVPEGLDAGASLWLAATGVTNVVGLALLYEGLRTGKIGIVAPITSTEGAVAAIIAVLAGEQIASGAGVTLGVIMVGVVMAGVSRGGGAGSSRRVGRAVLCAAGAAVAFGLGLYAAARVGAELPIPWVLLPARALTVLVVALPLAATARLRLTRRAAPLVALAGLCEVGGLAAFTVGARHGIAVSVVLASLNAAIAAVAAYVLFRERLSRVQVGGVAAIVAGVAALGALQA